MTFLHELTAEAQEQSGSPAGATVPSADAREEAAEITILDLLIILAARKNIIFAVAAVCTILAAIVSLLLPNRYTASVVLLPPQQGQSMSSVLSSQLGSLGGMAALAGGTLGLKNPNDMYVAMLRSDTVEEAMIRDFGLQQEYHDRYLSDTRRDLERHVEIDGSGKDGLIHISISDHDARRASAMANGYVDRFRNLTEHLAITEASRRRLFFENQLQQAKDQLAGAEEALKETQQKTGMIQLDSQARALVETAATLRAQVAAKEVQIQAMQTYENGQNAELVQAKQELQGLQDQLARLGGEQSGSGELIMPRGAVSQAGIEYVRRLRDVKYDETIFEILARQYEVAKLDEAREGALIQVLDPARTPDKKSFPKRTAIVLGSMLVGLFLGMLAALTMEAAKRLKGGPLNDRFIVLRDLLIQPSSRNRTPEGVH